MAKEKLLRPGCELGGVRGVMVGWSELTSVFSSLTCWEEI